MHNALAKAAIGLALRADRGRLEPGAQSQCVIDDDRAAPALDQAFALHGVDLARDGFAPCVYARGEFRLVRRRENDGALRILAIGTGEAQEFGVDAAANVKRAKLADPAGHRAIARDQRPDDRFAERAMGEHRLHEDRARHFRDRRVIDREDAERAGAAVEGGQFAKERARFHVRENKVLPHPVRYRPQASGHDEIDIAVIGRLTEDPLTRRRLQPDAMAIQNPTRFGIERLEAGMRRKRAYDHRRARRGLALTWPMSGRTSKRLCPGRPGVGPPGAKPSPSIWAASATLRVIARLRTTSVAITASPSGRWLNIVATKTLLGILARVESSTAKALRKLGTPSRALNSPKNEPAPMSEVRTSCRAP